MCSGRVIQFLRHYLYPSCSSSYKLGDTEVVIWITLVLLDYWFYLYSLGLLGDTVIEKKATPIETICHYLESRLSYGNFNNSMGVYGV